MEQFDIVRVEEAITEFYRSNGHSQELDKWLTEVKASSQVWQLTFLLLQPGKSTDIQFFGATALHSKLRKDWDELSVKSRGELRQKILQLLGLFAGGPKIVLNRLCMSLGAYLVQMQVENRNPALTPIEEVTYSFQNDRIPNSSHDVQIGILLEILGGIPEEAHSIVTRRWRNDVHELVGKSVSFVLQTAENYLKTKQLDSEIGNHVDINRAVGCIRRWIQNYGYTIEGSVNISQILLELVQKCYWPRMRVGDGVMAAEEIELAELALRTLSIIIIQPCNSPQTAIELIKMFLDSLSDIAKSEWQETKNEKLEALIYSLYMTSIEQHSSLIINGITADPELFRVLKRIIDELMKCTDKPGTYPDGEICSIKALPFWHLLQHEVCSIPSNKKKLESLEFIKPVYAGLTRVLVRKAEYPKSFEQWNSETLDTFTIYRQDIAKALSCCYKVLKENALEILSGMLNEASAEVKVNPTNWTALEVCIFSFMSVAKVCGGDSLKIPELMRIMTEIPFEHCNVKLLATVLETIGAYGHWLRKNRLYVPEAINLLIGGLSSSVSIDANLALKEFITHCDRITITPETLMEACRFCLNPGYIKESDMEKVISTIGTVMGIIPIYDIYKKLDSFLNPWLEELQAICRHVLKTPLARSRILVLYKMMCPLFLSLKCIDVGDKDDDYNFCFLLLLVSQKLIQLWSDDMEVIETVCTTLSHLISFLSCIDAEFEHISRLVQTTIEIRYCPPVLEMITAVIVTFYEDEVTQPEMQELLRDFIQRGFMVFEATPVENYSNISDIIELPYNRLVAYALKGMSLQEGVAIRGSINFLVNLLSQARCYGHLEQIVLGSLEEIFSTSIMCIASFVPPSEVENFAGLFFALNKHFSNETLSFVFDVLSQPDFPKPHITLHEKTILTMVLLKETNSEETLRKCICNMALRMRGLAEHLQ
ncbi:importin-13-like [Drosophila serrata]|uniref:importin-13-like n=1 Tax=Drosophila serrata TaxID=7274 RepID=UPI000A1D0DC2|nr:importin-13-like [Drosophila serrata]